MDLNGMLSEVISTWARKSGVFEDTVAVAESAVDAGAAAADAPCLKLGPGPASGRPRMSGVMGLEVTEPTCETAVAAEGMRDDPLTACTINKIFTIISIGVTTSINSLYLYDSY